jgi:hypothetical protein
LVENGDVAEEFFHAVGDRVVDAGYKVVGVWILAPESISWTDGGLREECSEFAAATDCWNK